MGIQPDQAPIQQRQPGPGPSLRLLLVYAGRLPNYFRLFVESCRSNPTVDWAILCDQPPPAGLPGNVEWIGFSLDSFASRAESRLGIRPRLTTPYKLCDFKPCLAYMYPEIVRGYEYWGHCDPDIVWGDLRRFMGLDSPGDLLKLQMSGALSLYKNCDRANSLFMLDHPTIDWRVVLSSDRNFSFDEWEGLWKLMCHHGIECRLQNYMAEALVDRYDVAIEGDSRAPSLFTWQGGALRLSTWQPGGFFHEDFAYIHLQKRSFLAPGVRPGSDFAILPGRFVEIDETTDLRALAALNCRSRWRDLLLQVRRLRRAWGNRRRFDKRYWGIPK